MAFTSLDTPQAGVDATRCDQFIVAAMLNELTALENEDAVGVADGGEAVSDDDGCAADSDLFERALDEGLGLVVDRGGGLVEDQDGRVFENGARNGDALALSAGELLSALADDGVVAVRQGHDEVVRFGDLGGLDNLLVGGVEGAIGDVLADGAVEEIDVLADKADGAAQVFEAQIAQVMPVETDAALFHVIEAQKQFDQGGLPGAGRADDADRLPGRDVQR